MFVERVFVILAVSLSLLIMILFSNKVILSVDKTLSERNGVTVFQKVFIISNVFLIKIPAI